MRKILEWYVWKFYFYSHEKSRPFGVALLIAGIDEYGPSLYHTDPSGTFVRYEAKAIGAASEGAQTTLQEEYHKVFN